MPRKNERYDVMKIDPVTLLQAYAQGIFPMGESGEDDSLHWVDPDWRGILPLDNFHIPRRLKRTVRAGVFDVRIDTAFAEVVRACAQPQAGRENTWINSQIEQLYGGLHAMGNAHSVECWEGNDLVGGLYGVSLGAAFFGESMFSLARDASKIALVHLVERLRYGGYQLLDTQFVTEHLRQFGTIEIPRGRYHGLLDRAIEAGGDFYKLPIESSSTGTSPSPPKSSSTASSDSADSADSAAGTPSSSETSADAADGSSSGTILQSTNQIS